MDKINLTLLEPSTDKACKINIHLFPVSQVLSIIRSYEGAILNFYHEKEQGGESIDTFESTHTKLNTIRCQVERRVRHSK